MKAEDLTTLLETGEKTPDEICPVLYTMSILGQRWKIPILWHLADKKLRFSELRKELQNATPKMLTQQLRELEAQELIHREVFPVVPPKVEYSLTELGRSLMPILVAMRDWGSGYLREHALEPNCFMMKTNPVKKVN